MLKLSKFFNLQVEDKDYYKKYCFRIFGIPFKIGLQKLSKNTIKKLNSRYERVSNLTYGIDVPYIADMSVTLDELINTNKSICRYGDGEFDLIFGKDLPFQKYSENLSKRLHEILISNDEQVMVAIPDRFGSLDEFVGFESSFWRKYMVYNREKVYHTLNMNKKYYDTSVSRSYIALKDKSGCKKYFEDFKKIYADKDIIFVEGQASRLGYKNDLFEGAKSIKRIICPAKNAYEKYAEILDICKKQPKDSLFIIALGPTATVLAYDLANSGYRALDLGHIDIEYEWFLMGAKKKVAIKNKYVNEVKSGRKISNVEDENYLNQIIVDLS